MLPVHPADAVLMTIIFTTDHCHLPQQSIYLHLRSLRYLNSYCNEYGRTKSRIFVYNTIYIGIVGPGLRDHPLCKYGTYSLNSAWCCNIPEGYRLKRYQP